MLSENIAETLGSVNIINKGKPVFAVQLAKVFCHRIISLPGSGIRDAYISHDDVL